MERFAALLEGLSPASLSRYLAEVAEPDRIAALSLLAGQRPKRSIPLATLRESITARTGTAPWLFDASLDASGDACEVLALLDPPAETPGPTLAEALLHLRRGNVQTLAPTLPHRARALAYRLATGSFRKTLPMADIVTALAQVADHPKAALALRLAHGWPQSATRLADLTGNDPMTALHPDLLPLPAPLPDPPGKLGKISDWAGVILQGGTLVQLVLAGGETALWDIAGDLIALDSPQNLLTFAPRRISLLALLPAQGPQTIAALRPIDLLSLDGETLPKGLGDRRRKLASLLAAAGRDLPAAPLIRQGDWSHFAEDAGNGGLLLLNDSGSHHHWAAPRPRFRAVMVLVDTAPSDTPDITLALWDGDLPLPLTRLPLTLPEPDRSEVLDWIRTHAKDRFGPVRQLPPDLVFDLDCAALLPAPRRKLGYTLVDPRLIGWCRDLTGAEADRAQTLHSGGARP
jgi:DNA ligase-1